MLDLRTSVYILWFFLKKIYSIHPLKEFWTFEVYSKLFKKSLKIIWKERIAKFKIHVTTWSIYVIISGSEALFHLESQTMLEYSY